MKKGTRNLIQTIRIHCQDIGMESGIEKCAMVIMRREKRTTEERQITTKSRKN